MLAAHTVVRGVVPPRSVVAGVPGRILQNRVAIYAAEEATRIAIADIARKTQAAARGWRVSAELARFANVQHGSRSGGVDHEQPRIEVPEGAVERLPGTRPRRLPRSMLRASRPNACGCPRARRGRTRRLSPSTP